jgi:hypothetical protein
MAQSNYRKRFFRANKYQKKIIILAFLPVITIIVLMWLFLSVFYQEMVGVILYQSSTQAVKTINHWGAIIGVGFMALLIGVLYWSFSLSLHLVGAFERIIKELDEVIGGRSSKPLSARPKDELANELLKRINVLIERKR